MVGDPVTDADAHAARAGDAAGRRADQQAHRGRRRCWASCSSTRRDFACVPTRSTSAGREVVAASYDALAALPDWSTAAIEEALREALVEGLGLKPRLAFGPVRVAVTGQPDQPAAVRVAGAARPRAVARPARGRARVSEAGAPAGLPYHRLQRGRAARLVAPGGRHADHAARPDRGRSAWSRIIPFAVVLRGHRRGPAGLPRPR